jgi:hypothetical protein
MVAERGYARRIAWGSKNMTAYSRKTPCPYAYDKLTLCLARVQSRLLVPHLAVTTGIGAESWARASF